MKSNSDRSLQVNKLSVYMLYSQCRYSHSIVVLPNVGELAHRSSRIVCVGVRWNLLGKVGGTPGVGVLIGRSIKIGGGPNTMGHSWDNQVSHYSSCGRRCT